MHSRQAYLRKTRQVPNGQATPPALFMDSLANRGPDAVQFSADLTFR